MNFDPNAERSKYALMSRDDLELEIFDCGAKLDELLIKYGYEAKGYDAVDYSSDYRYWNKTRLIERLLDINREIAELIDKEPPPPPPIPRDEYDAHVAEFQQQLAEKEKVISDLQSKLTESQAAAESAAQGAATAIAAAQAELATAKEEAKQATDALATAQAETQQAQAELATAKEEAKKLRMP